MPKNNQIILASDEIANGFLVYVDRCLGIKPIEKCFEKTGAIIVNHATFSWNDDIEDEIQFVEIANHFPKCAIIVTQDKKFFRLAHHLQRGITLIQISQNQPDAVMDIFSRLQKTPNFKEPKKWPLLYNRIIVDLQKVIAFDLRGQKRKEYALAG